MSDISVPPYIQKKYKILPRFDASLNRVVYDFVDYLTVEGIQEILELLEIESLPYGNQITEEEFNTIFDKIIEDEPEKEPSTIVTYDSNPITTHQFLEQIPTEVLIKEIRTRQLKKPMTGVLQVTNNGVAFSLDTLEWPIGTFRMQITAIEDITTIQQQNNAEKVSNEKNQEN